MTGVSFLLIGCYMLITVCLVAMVSKPHRWKVLLLTSLIFFYFLIGNKIIIILMLSAVTYFYSHWSYIIRGQIWIPVLMLLVPMILYKSSGPVSHFTYYNIQSLSPLQMAHWTFWFHIVGLSYFTFNSISYLVDIRRKYILPERNYLFLLLYLIYFPAVFSGPLHRAKYIFEQFKNIGLSENSIVNGLRLMLWGVFKNVVIAQRIYLIMGHFLSAEISGVYYLLVGFLFFIYLYCNFSSFIDFFQGVSQVFGVRLKNNFSNRVYLASSRQEFWKGWHITLNEWFRDYFFFVISRYVRKRSYVDILLLVTFILIALWHELSMILLFWGVLNGLWIILEKKFDHKKWELPKPGKFVGVGYHLLISSVLAMIFISPSWDFIYQKVVVQEANFPVFILKELAIKILIVGISFFIMDFYYSKASGRRVDDYLAAQPKWIRWAIYFKLAIMILIFGVHPGLDNYYIQF